MTARSYVCTPLLGPGMPDRRRPENETQRRLFQIGRLLALHARQPGLNLAARNLADAWDSLLAELHGAAPSTAPAETIGECELCGDVDHHLVEGVCPACRPLCVQVAAEVPLGAEADVSHALPPVRPGSKP